MADDYVCTLDEKTLEKAKKELNEDPKNRLGAVQTLREWIQQQPHLHCKTGKTYFEVLYLAALYTVHSSHLRLRSEFQISLFHT